MENKEHQDVEKILIEEILADARRKAERTVSRAEREGEKLVEGAAKDAETLREHVLHETQERIGRERRVSLSSLRLEERMRRLKTQGELIEEVFAQALGRLKGEQRDRRAGETGKIPPLTSSPAPKDPATVVRRLAVEAVLAMSPDASGFVLHLTERDLESMKNTLPDEVAAAVRQESGREVHVTTAPTARPIEGGVIVETEDGRERVDNSFVTRLSRMKEELRFDIAELLFPEKEPTG